MDLQDDMSHLNVTTALIQLQRLMMLVVSHGMKYTP
jgi:hypothetical protein